MTTSRLRVLHVSPYFAPAFAYGGPPRSILGLCKELPRHGVDVEVMTTTAGGPEAELPAALETTEYDGVRVRYFPLAEPRRFWNAPGLRRTLAREARAYHVIHVHGLWNLPAWDAARLARRSGVPYVISPRGMLEREAMAIGRGRKAVAFRLVERRNIESSSWLHATSRREVETLEAARFGPPVVFAPNGVDVDELKPTDPDAARQKFGIGPAEKIVLFLGRIHPIKRLDLIAASVGRLASAIPDIRVVVAGSDADGWRSRVADHFADAGVGVTWTGAVTGTDKANLLAAARVLVSCSDSESFGMSVAEAMAVGTPVVVTRTCPWADVERESAGRWVPQDAESISAALGEILRDEVLARSMGERGRALVARSYTWPAAARAIADGYRSVIVPSIPAAHAS
jgi:glycosyltransferase involved in cell wall biosynthesis